MVGLSIWDSSRSLLVCVNDVTNKVFVALFITLLPALAAKYEFFVFFLTCPFFVPFFDLMTHFKNIFYSLKE